MNSTPMLFQLLLCLGLSKDVPSVYLFLSHTFPVRVTSVDSAKLQPVKMGGHCLNMWDGGGGVGGGSGVGGYGIKMLCSPK